MPLTPRARSVRIELPSSISTPKDRVRLARSAGVGVLVLLTSAACAEGPFTVKYAPDFAPGPSSISVFGVFTQGRMSKKAWEQLRLHLASPFNEDTCEVAYGEKLVTSSPAVSSAVDEYATANGVTDELLDQFGPMAKGAMILVIAVSGHPPQPIDDSAPDSQISAPPKVRGRRGASGGLPVTDPRKGEDQSLFEVSASFFSVRLHHSVASVDMAYSGSSVNEAFTMFANKFATEMPNSACGGWNWDVHVDDKKIHDMVER